eukprot:TRINITY_DN2743_c2_g1_i1.p1 TRINITY_DN2743_c2_g1~~TRINITY_DN2743_c2_g1_i1.p1  ORF type:complete len:250 (+),score=41.27 TRINITY_DN2743_c2_g1_i1:47-796(+)
MRSRGSIKSRSFSCNSNNSSSSFRSASSRCSTNSASRAQVVQHEGNVAAAFKKGEVNFLVNLLGPVEACVGFLRQGMAEAQFFIDATVQSVPTVTLEEVKAYAKQNFPTQVASIVLCYESLERRLTLSEYFDKEPSNENVKKMVEMCGGSTVPKGDLGVVLLFSECCRRQHDAYTFLMIQQHGRASAMLDVLHARSVCSKEFFTSEAEKKQITRYCKKFLKENSDRIKVAWAERTPPMERNEGGCCTIQ